MCVCAFACVPAPVCVSMCVYAGAPEHPDFPGPGPTRSCFGPCQRVGVGQSHVEGESGSCVSHNLTRSLLSFFAFSGNRSRTTALSEEPPKRKWYWCVPDLGHSGMGNCEDQGQTHAPGRAARLPARLGCSRTRGC